MKNAHNYFTQEQQDKIVAAVKAAEANTSGEIVPMLVTASYDYPQADLIGGSSLALITAALTSWGFGTASIWWFLPVFIVSMPLFQLLIRQLPGLKRKLISNQEMMTEVKEKAMVSFLEHNLHQTRDHTGILILISLFERRVQVLADSGINACVDEKAWDEVVAMITDGLKHDQACEAICKAIAHCGTLLETAVPQRQDDTDELRNLVIEE